jgi:hypothetical protein
MKLVTLDGPTKTGKTCLGEHLQGELADQGIVRFDSIGNYFRRLAVLVAAEVGYKPEEAEMLLELKKAIADDEAFDNVREWGDLHSAEVNGFVSTVGATALAQDTKYTWAEKATSASRAEKTDIWIVDGRNPRRTLVKEINTSTIDHETDLYMECGSAVSAWRSGLELAVIEDRRMRDTSGDDPLLVRPEHGIEYCHGVDVEGVVARSRAREIQDAPLPIYFDTTNLGVNEPDKGRALMCASGLEIVKHALEMI